MAVSTAVNQRMVDVHGRRVHLLDAGSGPAIVFLHGAGGAGNWSPFLERLARQYRVLAPSHPSFGESDPLPYTRGVQDLALHTLDLLDTLDLEHPVLIGTSLGGWIAAELSVWQPHRASHLVLASSAGLRHPDVPQPDLFAAGPEESARLLNSDPSKAPPADPSPEAVRRRMQDRAALARVAWNPYLHDPALPHRLYRITTPTLLVWGQDDRLIPPAIGQLWAEKIPHARFVTIPACGHSIQREQPGALSELVLEFLAESPRRSA